jgi:hypothetical protein
MKRFYSHLATVFLICCLLFSLCDKVSAQNSIPNADFENWASGEPNDWNTSNTTVLFTQFTTVIRETNSPQHGTSSARLQTVTQTVFPLGSVSIPGILTLGVLNIDYVNQTASLTGGAPFTGVPQSMTGYYKYQPTTLDSCYLGFGLFRWYNGTRDTIGYSYVTIGALTTEWTAFEVPLNYQMWETPDTMNVVFLASNAMDGLPHGGTKLWVDNLALVYGNVSIEGISFPADFKLYADGEQHQLIVHPDLAQQLPVEMSIYSIDGHILLHQTTLMKETELKLNIENLAIGTYIFRANVPGEKPFARKFSVLH